jgi:hypothetical protein
LRGIPTADNAIAAGTTIDPINVDIAFLVCCRTSSWLSCQ